MENLMRIVDRVLQTDRSRLFQLQDSHGRTFGPPCRMLESNARQSNKELREKHDDYRWSQCEDGA